MRHSLAAVSALAGAPIAVAALACRPPWRIGFAERLGDLPALEPGSIWLHGASVGESRLVVRLAAALEQRGRAVFTTAQTHAGRAALEAARPSSPCGLAPLDHPWPVDRALARVTPAALVLCETEIWPCWIAGAARCGVPVAIVSGRISDRSATRYRWIGPVMARALSRLARIGARTRVDAERFVALGADRSRVSVSGDLKLAASLEPPLLADALRAALDGRRVLVAGSTHAGEEDAVLRAFDRVEQIPSHPTLVIAPRHLQRVEAVEAGLRAAGRPVRRRSQLVGDVMAPGEILLLDTLGELAAVYALACSAFVGGSLVPVGGHDPAEAVRQGCRVVIGPHHENVGEMVAGLVEAGALSVVKSASELGDAWIRTLSDGERSGRIDASALISEGEAVLARSVELIETLVDRSAR